MMVVSYKINMNTSKPLEHARSQGGGGMSECSGGNIGCEDKNSSW